MYRIWDNKQKKFLYDEFYLAPNNDLFRADKNVFGKSRLSLVSDSRYTYQMSIGLTDINEIEIFEGDICKANDGVIGLIAYVSDKASYLFLDYNEEKYYPLDDNVCNNFLEVVGNIFETPNLIKKSDFNEQQSE